MGAGEYHYPVFRNERPRRHRNGRRNTSEKDAMKFVAKILTIAAALSSLEHGLQSSDR